MLRVRPDFQNFPGTQRCQVLPVDATLGYGLACYLGSSTAVLEGDENTILNIHPITPVPGYPDYPSDRYDECNAEVPFACKKGVVDPENSNQINYWLGVAVEKKLCFVTEGNIQKEEDNPCFAALPECKTGTYATDVAGGLKLPNWDDKRKAYEGWPESNYKINQTVTEVPIGTPPPLPRCQLNQLRGKGGRPQQGGWPQQQGGWPQQGGRPQQGGWPQQQGGRPQQGGWPQQQGGRPQQGGWLPVGNRPREDDSEDD